MVPVFKKHDMTDTYNGKPIAEMTRDELAEALTEVLQRMEEFDKKWKRTMNVLTSQVAYFGSELLQ